MNNSRKKTLKLIFCFFLVINTSILFFLMNHFMSPNINNIAELALEKTIYNIASSYKLQTKSISGAENLLDMHKNSQNQITSMNYNMQAIYKIASDLERHILRKLKENSKINLYSLSLESKMRNQDQKIIMYIPLGLLTNSPLLANVGPKIPVTISFMDTFFTQIKTKVTDYGLNNALIEIYLNIKIHYKIIGISETDDETLEYDILLDSRIIQGNIPNWYAGSYEKRSKITEMNSK